MIQVEGKGPRDTKGRNLRKTMEDNISENYDQYEDNNQFEGSIVHIARIGEAKAVSRKNSKEKTVKI